MSTKKQMNIEEFIKFGYLQEANRRFFHPLGLELEVDKPRRYDEITKKRLADGETALSGIVDSRDEPRGMMFDEVDLEKAQRVADEMKKRRPTRRALLECNTGGLQKVPRG